MNNIILNIFFLLHSFKLLIPANGFSDGISTYDVIYGDLTNLEDMFILPMNNTKTTKPNDLRRNLDKVGPPTEDLMAPLHPLEPNKEHDINDFNLITRSLNLTRKYRYLQYGYWQGWDDPEDYYDKNVTEDKKKNMLIKINIQFLMHTRYKVTKALKYREKVKSDKRYRLGYLFNRMRRLLTEQRKMVTIASRQYADPKHENLMSTLALYEQVVRLDVDMKDTVALIKQVYGEHSRFDDVDWTGTYK